MCDFGSILKPSTNRSHRPGRYLSGKLRQSRLRRSGGSFSAQSSTRSGMIRGLPSRDGWLLKAIAALISSLHQGDFRAAIDNTGRNTSQASRPSSMRPEMRSPGSIEYASRKPCNPLLWRSSQRRRANSVSFDECVMKNVLGSDMGCFRSLLLVTCPYLLLTKALVPDL